MGGCPCIRLVNLSPISSLLTAELTIKFSIQIEEYIIEHGIVLLHFADWNLLLSLILLAMQCPWIYSDVLYYPKLIPSVSWMLNLGNSLAKIVYQSLNIKLHLIPYPCDEEGSFHPEVPCTDSWHHLMEQTLSHSCQDMQYGFLWSSLEG